MRAGPAQVLAYMAKYIPSIFLAMRLGGAWVRDRHCPNKQEHCVRSYALHLLCSPLADAIIQSDLQGI